MAFPLKLSAGLKVIDVPLLVRLPMEEAKLLIPVIVSASPLGSLSLASTFRVTVSFLRIEKVSSVAMGA